MSSANPERYGCGTPAGARRHYRRGEKPCLPCRAAANADKVARTGGDPYRATEPDARDGARNGLAIVSYEYRIRAYPWAQRAILRAEATYGKPDNEREAS